MARQGAGMKRKEEEQKFQLPEIKEMEVRLREAQKEQKAAERILAVKKPQEQHILPPNFSNVRDQTDKWLRRDLAALEKEVKAARKQA